VDASVTQLPDEEAACMRKRINLGGLEGYARTFSAFRLERRPSGEE
jgi:hypothetical protein